MPQCSPPRLVLRREGRKPGNPHARFSFASSWSWALIVLATILVLHAGGVRGQNADGFAIELEPLAVASQLRAPAAPASARGRAAAAATCFARCNDNADCGSGGGGASTCPYCSPTTRTCVANPMCRWRCFTAFDCTVAPPNMPNFTTCGQCVEINSELKLCLSDPEQPCQGDGDCRPDFRCASTGVCVGNPRSPGECGAACGPANASSVCSWPCATCSDEGQCVADAGGRCAASNACGGDGMTCVTGPYASESGDFPGYCAAATAPTTLAPTPAPTPVPTTTVTTTTTTPVPTTTDHPPTLPPPSSSSSASPHPTSGTGTAPFSPTETPKPDPTPTPSEPRTTRPGGGDKVPDEHGDRHAGTATMVLAVALPLGALGVLLFFSELGIFCCVVRRGRGNIVLGVDVSSDSAVTVRLCLVNSRHTTTAFLGPFSARDGVLTSSFEATQSAADESSFLLRRGVSPTASNSQGPGGGIFQVDGQPLDALIACAIVHALSDPAVAQEPLAAMVACVPGLSYEDGALTCGASARATAVLSALVKAKAMLAGDDTGGDGSLAGVQIFAPSVVLSVGCAVAFRVLEPNSSRPAHGSEAPALMMAIHLGQGATVCSTFTAAWDARGTTCWVEVASDAFDAEPIDDRQMSDMAVSHWVQRALRPVIERMLADAEALMQHTGAFDVPIALTGSKATHRAVVDELSRHTNLHVWYPHRHEAIQREGALAFGAAILAASECPSPQVRVVVHPTNELVAAALTVDRAAPPALPHVASQASTVLTPVHDEHAGFAPGSLGSTSSANHNNNANGGRATRRSTLSHESGDSLSSVGSCYSRNLLDTTPRDGGVNGRSADDPMYEDRDSAPRMPPRGGRGPPPRGRAPTAPPSFGTNVASSRGATPAATPGPRKPPSADAPAINRE